MNTFSWIVQDSIFMAVGVGYGKVTVYLNMWFQVPLHSSNTCAHQWVQKKEESVTYRIN